MTIVVLTVAGLGIGGVAAASAHGGQASVVAPADGDQPTVATPAQGGQVVATQAAEDNCPSLSSLIERYDTDDDCGISIGEYGQAGLDYANNKISIGDLGRVAIAYANTVPAPFSSFNVTIDTNETFLRTDTADDPGVPKPDPISLDNRSISPGDTIVVEVKGRYYAGGGSPNRCQAIGVFSRTSEILAPGQRDRVPGAIDAGTDHTTVPTANRGFTTDIPEDFLVSGTDTYLDDCNQTQVRVTVPSDAEYLFIVAEDDYYSDNDEDLAFEIRPAG